MATKAEQIASFEPDGVGRKGSLFGLPFTPETADVVILPVPWEVTVSYRAGTAGGPMAVLEASPQIDYEIPGIPHAWKTGIAMAPFHTHWAELSAGLRKRSEAYIDWLEEGNGQETLPEEFRTLIEEVDAACEQLAESIVKEATGYLEKGKVVGLLGGDHSTPFGLLRALSNRYPDFGILQVDAHADLRKAYEGFRYSHASIMYNALENAEISRLVQVGVRDYCGSEKRMMEASGGRIRCFFDADLKARQFRGVTWESACQEIIESLPGEVYVSFDIDGLEPALCPQTGTPVPGGLRFEEAVFLIAELVRSGRRIIGFDLCEVGPGPDSWDGNVGARILYQLATRAGLSMRGSGS